MTEAEQATSDLKFVRAEMRERFGFSWAFILPLIVKFLPVLIEIIQYLLAQRLAEAGSDGKALQEAEWVVARMDGQTRQRYLIHRSGRAG
jgi:hypothetical protein